MHCMFAGGARETECLYTSDANVSLHLYQQNVHIMSRNIKLKRFSLLMYALGTAKWEKALTGNSQATPSLC